MSAPKIVLRSSLFRRLRAPLALGFVSLAVLGACSEGGLVPSDAGPVGTGGAASGGATASGGTASGGGTATGGAATTGGASSGGAASGGASSGGAASTGGASSGGAASGGASSGGAGTGGGATEFALTVTGVDALDNDDCDDGAEATCPLYPEDNTSFGENVSPAMSWTAGPEGTLSYAITLYDISGGNAHWALYDLPAATLELPAELPSGATLTTPVAAKQAGFSAGMPSYFGSGACENVYEFRLYALSTATFEVSGANDAAGVIDALEATTPLGETFVRMQSRDYCP